MSLLSFKVWEFASSSMTERRKDNVVGSGDGDKCSMLATVIVILTHLLLTNVFHRRMASTAGSNHRKNFVSETGEQTECLVTEGDREALGNRCNCVLSCFAA